MAQEKEQRKEEKRGVIAASKVFLMHEGRALLVRRSQTDRSSPGAWEMPGGRIEWGEDPEDTARRETLEEAGLEPEIDRLLYAITFMKENPPVQLLILTYFGRAAASGVTLSFEHDAYHWATRADLYAMLGKGTLGDMERFGVFSQPDIARELLEK